MTLSAICPIYNEEKYIEAFLESLLLQDFQRDDMEILLVDGMSEDKTRRIVKSYSDKYPFLKLIDNPLKTVPYAMNKGITIAKGIVIVRLDAHAEYPKDYFSVLVDNLGKLAGAENVGGVCITLPCNDSSVSVTVILISFVAPAYEAVSTASPAFKAVIVPSSDIDITSLPDVTLKSG